MTVFWRYWLLQVPGWIVLGALTLAAHRWLELSPFTAVIVILLWLVKDIVLYPVLRPYYADRPRVDHPGYLGEQAVAQQALQPRGYVKIRGELWMAELPEASPDVSAGETVVVDSVDGLTLRVRRWSESR